MADDRLDVSLSSDVAPNEHIVRQVIRVNLLKGLSGQQRHFKLPMLGRGLLGGGGDPDCSNTSAHDHEGVA